MIKTTSLELSKRLYELAPEWNDTSFYWHDFGNNTWRVWYPNKEMFEAMQGIDIPAPDLDWLLDKLPEIRLETWHNGNVVVKHYTKNGVPEKVERLGFVVKAEADTPSDAACKLLINLIEQQVIIPNGDK